MTISPRTDCNTRQRYSPAKDSFCYDSSSVALFTCPSAAAATHSGRRCRGRRRGSRCTAPCGCRLPRRSTTVPRWRWSCQGSWELSCFLQREGTTTQLCFIHRDIKASALARVKSLRWTVQMGEKKVTFLSFLPHVIQGAFFALLDR